MRHAVHIVDETADRGRDAARDQRAEHQPPERAEQPGDRALSEKQPSNLSPRGAERTQNPDLRPPLRDGDRERVVDDEHPDEQREEARDVHHHRVGGEHRFELLPTARRRIDLETGPEERAQLLLAFGDPAARSQREIDAIELTAAAEHLLRGVDVHDGEVATERARQPGRFHDAADREPLHPAHRAECQLAVHAEMVLLREGSRQHDRVGLGQEDQRIVDRGFVAAVKGVVAEAAVAGHVDAEDQEAAFALDAGVGHRLDHRYRDAHGRGALDFF